MIPFNNLGHIDSGLKPMILEVDTTITGTSPSDSFIMPWYNVGYSGTPYQIDWGDGNKIEYTTGNNITYQYGAGGIYEIKIYGTEIPFFRFANAGDKNKLTKIKQWGAPIFKGISIQLSNCINMNITATDAPNFPEGLVTNMNYFLAGNPTLDCNINHWNMSYTNSLYLWLSNCDSFNSPLNDWDVSNVTSMQQFMEGSAIFNQPLNNWDTSNVTNMFRTFWNASSFNQSLGSWDVSQVTNMDLMLSGTALSTANYDDTLTGWLGWSGGVPTKTLKTGVKLGVSGLTYTLGSDAEDARNYLINTLGWTITGDSGI